MPETYLVTALPHSAAGDAPFHLSLFVTHRLTPERPQAVLADFPVTADWTARVRDARLVLRGWPGGQPVELAGRLLLDVLQPDLWPRVFPGDLAVTGWTVPDRTAEPWRTFPAHRMQQHALLVHALSVFSSPTAPPAPDRSLVALTVLRALSDRRQAPRVEDVLDGELDRLATRRLDAVLDEPRLHAQTLRPTPGVPAALQRALVDAHQTRRYYLRPEEQRPYAARPDPQAQLPDVPRPEVDFGRRVGSLGDQSRLLRALGLVLDVVVDDVAALREVTALQGELVLPDVAALPSPRTACEVSGEAFYAAGTSGVWHRGRLRVGAEDAFTVLDLDPDASGLKLEQFLRNVPRLVASHGNGEPETAAPATLRATGFALAENDRADGLHGRLSGGPAADAALLAGTLPPLSAEQVTRGLRLEVWDDVSRAWHSLHWRSTRTTVDGTPVLADEPEQGFLQGASLTSAGPGTPRNAHEVVAGWDGWSLAVPRPGAVVVHRNGTEQVLPEPPADPDPLHPVATQSQLVPGTLPRLRYGRSYSFRAWSVDLAGNSRPHDVQGPGQPAVAGAAGPAGLPVDAAAQALAALRRGPTSLVPAEGDSAVVQALTRQRPSPPPTADLLDVLPPTVTGLPSVDRLVAARALARRAEPLAVPRTEQVAAAFAASAAAAPALLQRIDARVEPQLYADAVGVALDGQGQVPETDLVTAPRPFLRWDAVLEPAVVPRRPYSTGESLLRVVLRSGVDLTGPQQVVVVPPQEYADRVAAAHPDLAVGWAGDAQRHLLPPKTSQLTVELHGRLDDAFGGADPAAVRRALAVSLREAGTLLDTTVADLDVPGARLPQPGVQLHVGPTADPPEHADPADVPRGQGLSTGQYVTHDVDELVVPYLPDPLATGLSLHFPDARPGDRRGGLLAGESTVLRYPGSWPVPTPYRLALTSGPQLDGRVQGSQLTVAVPPGEQLRMRLSSALDAADLPLLGLWRSLPDLLQAAPAVVEAAADGELWWLTPSAELVLVHAVPRPVQVPRVMQLVPVRTPGSTSTVLVGAVDVHGPSTGRLDVEASWSEWHDDPAKPAPERLDVVAVACGTTVDVEEDLVVLVTDDGSAPQPDGTTLRLHRGVHAFGDTRHRVVDYVARGTTRYREFFPALLTPEPDDLSVVSAPYRVSVPSSARPGRVPVHDVLPLFRWSDGTESGHPFATRRTRRSGLRLWLDRPWYTTGDGELLAVLLGSRAAADVGAVSVWGADPVWAQQGPTEAQGLPLSDVLHLAGLDDRLEPGRPVRVPALLPLTDVTDTPQAWALGYAPEFSPERGRWFVDVALDPGTAVWPFVRLSVARWQPDSLPGLQLGPITTCDWAQLPPERTTTVARTDASHVEVTVSGPVGIPLGAGPPPDRERVDLAVLLARSRTVRVRLERRVAEVGTDLGWQVLAVRELPVLGVAGPRVTWGGELAVPPADPRRPGSDPELRVVVEEEERLRADPSPRGVERTSSRVCYLDILPL